MIGNIEIRKDEDTGKTLVVQKIERILYSAGRANDAINFAIRLMSGEDELACPVCRNRDMGNTYDGSPYCFRCNRYLEPRSNLVNKWEAEDSLK